MAFLVHMKFRAALPSIRFSLHLTAQVKIADPEYTFVDVVIQCSFRNGHAVGKGSIRNWKRHTIVDQRDDSLGNILKFIMSCRDTGS